MVEQYRSLMQAQGDEQYGSVRVDRASQDARWLPAWFVLGQAADEVSVAYWADLATTRPVDEVAQLDLECRAAWDDPQRRDAALATTGDALRAQYAWLRAVGWHAGTPRPVANELDRGAPIGHGEAVGAPRPPSNRGAAPKGHGPNSNASGPQNATAGRTGAAAMPSTLPLVASGGAGGPARARRPLSAPPTTRGGY